MVKDIRVTYRRRHSYNTKSNKVRAVKTPGGRLVVHQVAKSSKGVKCRDCGAVLQGIARARPATFKRLPGYRRTVSRAYGGNACASCVRTRILRAFIIEEHKIAKSKIHKAAAKAKK